jgi:predicted RNA-binding Zn ribbon-like protein
MQTTYPGPLGDEPLAVELHNTLYAVSGTAFDYLPESSDAWLTALGPRLPAGPPWPAAAALIALRDVVRGVLRASVDSTPTDRAALEALNRASAQAPRSPAAEWRAGLPPAAAIDRHGASRADIVIAAFAADAIELITGPHRDALRACGAPGCVLMFLKNHPRREWCSNACGNRARQARHYARTRRHVT